MHAASVYPEPGSNSPKRCATLRPRLLSEGLTTRTSLSRISCHSSVVKVQRPKARRPAAQTSNDGASGAGCQTRRIGGSDPSQAPVKPTVESLRPPSEETPLDEQDEGRATEPAEQPKLDRARGTERPDQHDVEDDRQ